eukprot:sb/3473859/
MSQWGDPEYVAGSELDGIYSNIQGYGDLDEDEEVNLDSPNSRASTHKSVIQKVGLAPTNLSFRRYLSEYEKDTDAAVDFSRAAISLESSNKNIATPFPGNEEHGANSRLQGHSLGKVQVQQTGLCVPHPGSRYRDLLLWQRDGGT